MRSERYSRSRRKVCNYCATAKARCDKTPGGCARCITRGLACSYAHTSPSSSSVGNTASTPDTLLHGPVTPEVVVADPGQMSIYGAGNQTMVHSIDTPVSPEVDVGDVATGGSTSYPVTEYTQALDFSDLKLICPIDADKICTRWLQPYVPLDGQHFKNYPSGVKVFINNMLKAYTTSTVRGHGPPPFVHHLQMTGEPSWRPLTICLSLVRICQTPLPDSNPVTLEILQREMSNLYEQYETYDHLARLVAFQAYLIYSMALFYRVKNESRPFLRQAIVNLQDIAASSSRDGLMCLAEKERIRPRWESWIIAESKRRTLFTMYLFDSMLSAEDNLPTFLGTELKGLLAPGHKHLWRSRDRKEWEMAYNKHLADWADEDFKIDELWPIPEEYDQDTCKDMQARKEKWLEGVDEFGTMLYGVTCCTHEV